MRIGLQRLICFPMWLKSCLLIGTAIVLSSPTLSIAQENTRPLVDRTTPELDDSLIHELRHNLHLLDGQLSPNEKFGRISVVSKALAKLKVASHSSNDQSAKNHLNYTILFIELPHNRAESVTEDWKVMGTASSIDRDSSSGVQPSSEVVSASHVSANLRSEFRISISDALNDEQIDLLVSAGTPVSSPKLMGENGKEVSMRVGREVPFVASFERLKGENGKETATLEPKVKTLHHGIQLDLTGTLDDDKKNVLLRVKFAQTELKHLDTLTIESEDGPLMVQQPTISATGIDTTCRVPLNKTIALCGGPIERDIFVEREAPLIKWIPYVGQLFKNTSKTTESISTIVLIRCHEHQAAPKH